jgi:phage gpG-like protein
MSFPVITIEFPQATVAMMERLKTMPERLKDGIRRAMDKAAALTVSDIQEKRLSGKGPFPVEEHRLGIHTNLLRTSLRATRAQVLDDGASTQVSLSIGTNVEYARIHEFGGQIKRVTKPGKVRLRTNKKGELLMRGNLATFANKRHKLVREVEFEGGKSYIIPIPARAPIGHGIADNAGTFTREIALQMRLALLRKGES